MLDLFWLSILIYSWISPFFRTLSVDQLAKKFQKKFYSKIRFTQQLPTKTSWQAKERTPGTPVLLPTAKETSEKRQKTLQNLKNWLIWPQKRIAALRTLKSLLLPFENPRLLKEDLQTSVLALKLQLPWTKTLLSPLLLLQLLILLHINCITLSLLHISIFSLHPNTPLISSISILHLILLITILISSFLSSFHNLFYFILLS